MTDKINIAFCTDENYIQHMCVALTSLLETNKQLHIAVHIVSPPLSDELRKRIDTIGHRYQRNIIRIEIDDNILKKLPVFHHFSSAMYYRLMLPDLLQVQKVIYLDCDILVEADISALWNCEIDQFGCAGTDEHSEWHSNRLQLSDGIYVNSGVLVLNLDFCRRHHFLQKCITWVTVNSPKLMFPDQDAINVILAGHKALLPSHFNLNPLSLSMPEDLKNIPNRILHFSGSAKPWHRYYQFEFQTLYRKYLEYTPWINEFKPLEPVSYGQALAAANQYFEKKDMQNAAIYYWQSMKFYLNDHKVESIFMLEVLNVAIDLFRREKHLDSATLFRTCLKQWGLPIDHMFNIYKYPGFLNG